MVTPSRQRARQACFGGLVGGGSERMVNPSIQTPQEPLPLREGGSEQQRGSRAL